MHHASRRLVTLLSSSFALVVALTLALVPTACGSSDSAGAPAPEAGAGPDGDGVDAAAPAPDGAVARRCADVTPTKRYQAGEKIFRRDCAACHSLGEGPRRGPDLLGVTSRRPDNWLERWLTDPAAMVEWNGLAKNLVAEWKYVMPDPGLDLAQIREVITFLRAQSATGPLVPTAPPALSPEAAEDAKALYFNRCAGCHGTMRAGATGPALDEARSKSLGQDTLTATIRHGTPRGMPAWGASGVLSEGEVECLGAFLQQPPPPAPALPLTQITQSWKLLVPTASRPSAPQHGRNWENFFGVILRDPGKVAIFDGDTREEIARIDTGFAAHILRSSSTGRYFYVVGRDGRVTLVDLWSSPPAAVAEVQGCYDARSVEGSKRAGYEDKYVIEGCYWPPQYVTFDGLTLEPRAVVDVLTPTVDTQQPLTEVRVASIAASPFEPLWAISLKESGHVGLVDYSQPGFPLVARIPAERFLHDGGWDHSKRYFLVAANTRDKMVVVDVQQKALAATIPTGSKPHPGRGANWLDPTYGWVNATTHLGEGKLTVYGADPTGRPEHAWKVVREVPLPSAGGLFLKTHDQSPWVLLDMPMSNDAASTRKVCAYAKQTGAIDRCFDVSTAGPAVHFEFDKTGANVWVSTWDTNGEIVVYDAVTLAEKQRIKGLPTPTGKFNVYNTAHDVY